MNPSSNADMSYICALIGASSALAPPGRHSPACAVMCTALRVLLAPMLSMLALPDRASRRHVSTPSSIAASKSGTAIEMFSSSRLSSRPCSGCNLYQARASFNLHLRRSHGFNSTSSMLAGRFHPNCVTSWRFNRPDRDTIIWQVCLTELAIAAAAEAISNMAAPGSRIRPPMQWSLRNASEPRASGVLNATKVSGARYTAADSSSWCGGDSYQIRCLSQGADWPCSMVSPAHAATCPMTACAFVPCGEHSARFDQLMCQSGIAHNLQLRCCTTVFA